MCDFRITFSKKGPLVFISHLDLAHTFIRAMNRAGIPMRYSSGFNPHPKLAFALPLSVGMAGENEMCDVGLVSDMQAHDLKERLAAVMPQYIEIKDVCAPGKKFREVCSADYSVIVRDTVGICQKIEAFSQKESILIIKRTKSGEKEADIKGQIFSVCAFEKDGNTEISLCVDASPDKYLNPEYVIKAMENEGILALRNCSFTREKINIKE